MIAEEVREGILEDGLCSWVGGTWEGLIKCRRSKGWIDGRQVAGAYLKSGLVGSVRVESGRYE